MRGLAEGALTWWRVLATTVTALAAVIVLVIGRALGSFPLDIDRVD